MMRNYSLAIHDLKVSGNEFTIETIKHLMDSFAVPLTVHLIFDKPLDNSPELYKFLKETVESKQLEIVFHGLTHQCSRKISKILAFYHKYQAEYLDDSDLLQKNTEDMFNNSRLLLGNSMGICPPCWIASKKNSIFLQTLKPLFIENILSISFENKKHFSPVISLGSLNNSELFFLKILARFMYILSVVKRRTHLRVAIHTCDLEKPASMEFFAAMILALNQHRFQPVLLKKIL
jgi:hypothetical protein